MTDHELIALFALAFISTFLLLLITQAERNHWKHGYETLSREVLAEGQAQSKRIVHELDAVRESAILTWDSWD